MAYDMNAKFNIVLVEPQIPQNTGNIARLCACTNSNLYLVGKLGFIMNDKYMKRAGIDYWDSVNYKHYISLQELQDEFSESNFYYCTTKSDKIYTQIAFNDGDFLVFGSETKGLSEDLINANKDASITIPMKKGQRSLNLSNSVAIVVYEAIRQVSIEMT